MVIKAKCVSQFSYFIRPRRLKLILSIEWKEYYPSPSLPPENFPVIPTPPGPIWCERPVTHRCPPDWSISLPVPHIEAENSESGVHPQLELPPSPLPCDIHVNEVKPKLEEEESLELCYPDDETEVGHIKEEPCSEIPIHEGGTQLIVVENPYGVQWIPKSLLPDVSDTWHWLQQFVEDIIAVYVVSDHVSLHWRHQFTGTIRTLPTGKGSYFACQPIKIWKAYWAGICGERCWKTAPLVGKTMQAS